MADALHGFGAGLRAHLTDPRIAGRAIGAGHADLDELVRRQGAVEFINHGGGQAVLADTHQRMAVMGARPEKPDLAGREHDAEPSVASEKRAASLAQARGPFDEVKIDLGAIIVVGVIGAPIVMWQLDGAAEWVLLGGYGCGAGLWLYCRTRGVLAAAEASRRDRTGGA